MELSLLILQWSNDHLDTLAESNHDIIGVIDTYGCFSKHTPRENIFGPYKNTYSCRKVNSCILTASLVPSENWHLTMHVHILLCGEILGIDFFFSDDTLSYELII